MPYTSDIPKATDNPSASQPLIKDNFAAINDVVGVNHVPFNEPNEGKHTAIVMVEQDVAPVTLIKEVGVYPKLSTLTNILELFFRRQASGVEIEFTSSLGAVNGWTRLPSGILIKWGTSSGFGKHTTNFPVSPNIPVFSTAYLGFAIPVDISTPPNSFVTFRTVSATGINVFSSSRTTTSSAVASYNYLAIGT